MSARLAWDKTGEHFFETGVDQGVLYKLDQQGAYKVAAPWNGLTAVNENPTGAEGNAQYADNIKYLNLISAEEWEGTIEAFTSPEEFDECDGSVEIIPGFKVGQQSRKMFGFSWRTLLGNDVDGTDYGYVIHVAYGLNASPSQKNYQTVNDSPEAMSLSWDVKSTPVPFKGHKPVATLEFDSTKLTEAQMKIVEDNLYGRPADAEASIEGIDAWLPLPSDWLTLLNITESAASTVTVLDPDGE